jgi:hypothetical protein
MQETKENNKNNKIKRKVLHPLNNNVMKKPMTGYVMC